MKSLAGTRLRLHLTPLAAALCLLAQPGWTQSFSQSGSNSTYPNNYLPFSGSPTSLNFGTDNVYIGNSAAGSFAAAAGAAFKAGSLSLGNGGSGTGTVTFSGAGTKVELGANQNRLEIGNFGSGTLTVSGGALLDATVNASTCSDCWNVIGNTAGSTGTFTITGAGSEVRTLRGFAVGTTWVSSGFGTPGGTTNADLNILDGGTLRTEGSYVAASFSSPNANGNEKVNGKALVSGTGSQWIVGHNSVDNVPTGLTLGFSAGADGSLKIDNGGSVQVDATNGVTSANDFVSLGVNGGTGTVIVTGAGSSLTLAHGGAIQSGRSNSGGGTVGQGSFSVLAGATVSATFLNVGRDGANGTATIDGAGSQLLTTGLGQWAPPTNAIGPAGGNVGWAGTGSVTVSNGGRWLISDGGKDTSTGPGSPHLNVGFAGGDGKLFIDGTGSTVEIVSTTIAPPPGSPDNYNPAMSVGRDGGTGVVDIKNGGRLLLTGGAPATPAFNRGTSLNIGGRNDVDLGGTGTVNVSGAGSEVRVTGADGFVGVGRNGTGTLNLSNGALLETLIVNVGRATNGNGTLTIDNATMLLNGQQTGSAQQYGAGLTVGSLSGTGVATIANGSVVTITNPGTSGASVNVGGTTPNPLGNGTLTLLNGSRIDVVTAPGLAGAQVGRDGTGSVTLDGGMLGGSRIDLGDGTLHIGRLPTGDGKVFVKGASQILAANVNIGGSSESDPGGTGTMSIEGAGSELKAGGASGAVHVGRGGTGTLALADSGKVSAIGMAVGRFASGNGTLNANNATLEFSGQQTSGALSGAFFSIGSGGGTGTVTLTDSTVTVANQGSAGIGVNLGGSGNYPGGTGALTMVRSSLTVDAPAGQGAVSIGRTGTGTAALDASTITNAAGNVYVGREAGSKGELTLSNGSVVNAGYFGIGVSQPYDGTQHIGGTGSKVVVNDSTINAGTFEVGAGSTLMGNNGTLNVVGDVIVGGVISPGTSPGRIRINCNLVMLPGSSIVLEIGLDQNGQIVIDNLILGSEALFDMKNANIAFSFLQGVDPQAVEQAHGLNLDLYLRSATGNQPSVPLSTRFAPGETWNDVVTASNVTATSTDFKITDWVYHPDTGTATFVQTPVPEPATWGLMVLGLLAVVGCSRRRRATAVYRESVARGES